MTRRRAELPQREADWQATVVALARLRGWLVHHQRPARTAEGGWRSAITGDAGFPDLVLVRDGRLVVAELKTDAGRLTAGQRHWLSALDAIERASGAAVEVYIWRPGNWAEVQEVLA